MLTEQDVLDIVCGLEDQKEMPWGLISSIRLNKAMATAVVDKINAERNNDIGREMIRRMSQNGR